MHFKGQNIIAPIYNLDQFSLMMLVGNGTTTVLQQSSTDQEHNDPCSHRMWERSPFSRYYVSDETQSVFSKKVDSDPRSLQTSYNFGKGSKINLIVNLQHKFLQQNVVTSCSPFMQQESQSLMNEAAP